MNIWLIILSVLLTVLYGCVRVARPMPVRLSRFEIERRAKEGDPKALALREQLDGAPTIRAIRWFVGVVIVLSLDTVLIGLLGWGGAIPVTMTVVLAIAWFEQTAIAKRFGKRLYGRIEPYLTRYAATKYFSFLPVTRPDPDARIDSEAELLHLLNGATFLEPDRRALIQSALEFTGLSVRDAMSGRRSIKSVDKSELLGPLVLDELYKTGRQAFIVTDGGLDTVVGILKLERLTSLAMQDSPPAFKAMSPEVNFIDVDAPITDALSYLRSSKAPFLVAQKSDGTTAGLLTMDNILRCLFEQ